MSQIKCCITGGMGFLGSHLVRLLAKHDYEITIIDDLSSGHKENVPESLNIKFLERDIADPYVFRMLDEVDYVFHMAAIASIQKSIDDPIKTHNTNIVGTLNILQYCQRTNAKLIFSSSSSIYRQQAPISLKENSPTDPLNPYALQKLQAEQYIRMYHRLYGLDYAILRYSNLFGERANTTGPYPAVTAIFLERYAKGQTLQITGNGKVRRDFIYAGDVAIANLMAMDWQGTYNIGYGSSCSINQIADSIGGKHKYVSARQGEMKDNTLDIDKALAMGWRPSIHVKDWIQKQVQA